MRWRLLRIAFALALAGALTVAPAPTAELTGTGAKASASTAVAKEAVPSLVPWTGPIEHLFFHTLVIRPELAFTGSEGEGFRDYFVTVSEFRSILDQLYANGWTLVDIHRAVAGAVRVPAGRKPLVLSEDDVNYYDYSRSRGLGWRLVLDPSRRVRVEVRDKGGVRVTDDDLVPLVDEFVDRHPLFSADGAKGVLGVTGFEGVLGERTEDKSSADRAASIARATAVAARLKATGWTFANHSFGHIDFATDATSITSRDTERWKAEVEPIVGPTDIFIYPFGAAPYVFSATVDMLREQGFRIFCDIDIEPRLARDNGVVVMSRRHVDGLAFEGQAKNLARFFNVAQTEDRAARDGAAP